jgi:hypothetical protein
MARTPSSSSTPRTCSLCSSQHLHRMSTLSARCSSPISPIISSLKLSEFGRYVKRLCAPPFNTNFLFRLGSLWKNLLSLLPPLALLITSLLQTLHAELVNPIHTILYILFMTSVCTIFSKTWIEVSGSGPRDMAKQLKDQQLVMAGHHKVSPPYHINQGPTQTMS